MRPDVELFSHIQATSQRMLAALPANREVVGLHAWAVEKGMPECCGEPLLFLCMGLLRASAQDVAGNVIRQQIARVIDSLQVGEDVTAHVNLEQSPGHDALAFVAFAMTFLVERGCPTNVIVEFVDRFLALMTAPVDPC